MFHLNLKKINKEEMIELENKFSNSKLLSSTLKELFQKILKFNKLNDNSLKFNEFYLKDNQNNNFSEEKRKNENTLRVQKGRLKVELEKYGYSLDKKFNLLKNNFSNNEIIDIINKELINIEIKEIKIFDSYFNDNKDKLLNSDMEKNLLRILEKEGKVDILSNFNTSSTRNFYKNLLNTSTKNNYNLYVKYLDKTFISNSIVYFLIKDIYNNNYVIYYEYLISFYYFKKIQLEDDFNFFNLLKNRFNFLFEDENKIINVDMTLFQLDFEEEVSYMAEKMNFLLSKNSLSENDTKKELDNLYKMYKNLKIAFPRSHHSSNIILNYIELIKNIYELRGDATLINSRKVIKILFSKKINDSFLLNVKDIIDKDNFLIFEENIKDSNFNLLKQKIHLEKLKNNKYLSEVFNEFTWNDKSSIINSFNRILLHNDLCFKFIDLFIYGYQKDKLKLDTPFLRAIVRIILKNYYIEYTYSEKSNLKRSIVSDLSFLDSRIHNLFQEIFPTYVTGSLLE